MPHKGRKLRPGFNTPGKMFGKRTRTTRERAEAHIRVVEKLPGDKHEFVGPLTKADQRAVTRVMNLLNRGLPKKKSGKKK